LFACSRGAQEKVVTRMRLNRQAIAAVCERPGVSIGSLAAAPERVVQFGEGNFLRSFVDWMIDAMNGRGLFGGRVVVVQPIERGTVETLNAQDGLYTLILRGLQGGQVVEQRRLITAISRGVDPYRDWNAFLAVAEQPELRFAVSNTTEAGIAYVDEPRPAQGCPVSFPAKVTAFLSHRFDHFRGDPAKGIVFLPCELIDRNGEQLRSCVLRHAAAWNLGPEFAAWVSQHNRFLNTLVDRIVPGYPHDEASALAEQLGYQDRLLTTGEIFHIWVIEGDSEIAKELPLAQAGLNVVWTPDLQPFRTRKVRILNGAHTMMALAAFLAGLDTVRECVEDPVLGAYVRRGVFDEILPLLPLPAQETRAFAEEVMERFANPFIKHSLISIALNSVSKYRVRVLPSLLEHRNVFRRIPPALTFSLAALLAFYRGTEIGDGALVGTRGNAPYSVKDDAPVLEAFADQWRAFARHEDAATLCRAILARRDFWGDDLAALPDLLEGVSLHLSHILQIGIRKALTALA
jgi:tagaturonate reductase